MKGILPVRMYIERFLLPYSPWKIHEYIVYEWILQINTKTVIWPEARTDLDLGNPNCNKKWLVSSSVMSEH